MSSPILGASGEEHFIAVSIEELISIHHDVVQGTMAMARLPIIVVAI
jgi:hypothetical protein